MNGTVLNSFCHCEGAIGLQEYSVACVTGATNGFSDCGVLYEGGVFSNVSVPVRMPWESPSVPPQIPSAA